MKITLAFPRAADERDAIGMHTMLLAEALAKHADVTVVTGRSIQPQRLTPADLKPTLPEPPGSAAAGLTQALSPDWPDWLVVPYNPFSWGYRGWAPRLVRTLRNLKRVRPNLGIALLVHETFMPASGLRPAAMSAYQRLQLLSAGRAADALFFTIEPWIQRFTDWFRKQPIACIPAGSNIDYVPLSKLEARRHLSIGTHTLLVGVFGSAHSSRLLEHIRAAYSGIRSRHDGLLVYVGPDGERLSAALDNLPFLDLGWRKSDEVSAVLSALDLHLVPFSDGVSGRRSSFLAGLQHGVPSLTTLGPLTDRQLWSQEGQAFAATEVGDKAGFVIRALQLATDAAIRSQLSRGGQVLFAKEYSWHVIARRLFAALEEATPTGVRRSHRAP